MNFDKLKMSDRIKQSTRRPKKLKGFCGNPSRSSTASSDLDKSTVVEQNDEGHIEQKGTSVAQKRRKAIRGQSKQKQDNHASKEEVVHAPGAF